MLFLSKDTCSPLNLFSTNPRLHNRNPVQDEFVTTSCLLHGWKVHGGKPWFITGVSVPAVPCGCSQVENSGFEGWDILLFSHIFKNINK